MKITTVQTFHVQPGRESGHLILVSGDERYKRILVRAFPKCTFTLSFPDRFGSYDWGTYIHGQFDHPELHRFLLLLTQYLCLQDDLTESFVLGHHGAWDIASGQYVRSSLGEILHSAKPYDARGASIQEANVLVNRLAQLISDHPTYRRANVVVPVPPSNPDKPFDLPTYMAEQLATRFGKRNGCDIVRKVRATTQQKQLHTPEEKVQNVYGAFAVSERLNDQVVIVLDDLYQSGATINEVGRVVKEAGAAMVLGLAVTKTQRHV